MSAFPTPDRTVTRNGCVHRSGRRVLGSPARASNTLAQVRALLGDIEPTEQTFASLDRDDIPHLETLLGDPEEWLASRAVHALSRLDDAGAHDLIKRAAVDPRGAVRVAVASAVPRLPEPLAERLLSDFLDDADVGVRKFALRAIPVAVPAALRPKIERLAHADVSEPIRALAATVRARMR